MTRIVFVISVVGLIFAAFPRPLQAAAIAPLPGVMTDHNVTQAWWWRSVCVRNRWGRLACRRVRVS
jgi:hypothetical protein